MINIIGSNSLLNMDLSHGIVSCESLRIVVTHIGKKHED